MQHCDSCARACACACMCARTGGGCPFTDLRLIYYKLVINLEMVQRIYLRDVILIVKYYINTIANQQEGQPKRNIAVKYYMHFSMERND